MAANAAVDLFGWDAEQGKWHWLSGAIDQGSKRGHRHLRQVAQRGHAVGPTQPAPKSSSRPRFPNVNPVSAGLPLLPDGLSELQPAGIYIGDFGMLAGDLSRVVEGDESAQADVMVAVRNWSDAGVVNRSMLRTMLENDQNRSIHIDNLSEFVQRGKYAGVVIDYRGVNNTTSAAFTHFITDLSVKLHEKGKRLAVTVAAPQLSMGAVTPPAYDYIALAQAGRHRANRPVGIAAGC